MIVRSLVSARCDPRKVVKIQLADEALHFGNLEVLGEHVLFKQFGSRDLEAPSMDIPLNCAGDIWIIIGVCKQIVKLCWEQDPWSIIFT